MSTAPADTEISALPSVIRASELIERLAHQIKTHGDHAVFISRKEGDKFHYQGSPKGLSFSPNDAVGVPFFLLY